MKWRSTQTAFFKNLIDSSKLIRLSHFICSQHMLPPLCPILAKIGKYFPNQNDQLKKCVSFNWFWQCVRVSLWSIKASIQTNVYGQRKNITFSYAMITEQCGIVLSESHSLMCGIVCVCFCCCCCRFSIVQLCG